MNGTKMKFFAQRDNMFGNSIAIKIAQVGENYVAIAEPLRLCELTEEERRNAVSYAPALILNRDAAQALIDELWSVGVRPTEGTGSAGSLAATERHLADMRALIAKTLSVEMPK